MYTANFRVDRLIYKGDLNMEKIPPAAACCGLYCEACGVYIATQEEPERLAKLAKLYGKEPEEIRCKGCRSDVLFTFCRTCDMRECAEKKGIGFCGECGEYPCSIIKEFQAEKPHRAEIFESLAYLKENGLEAWGGKMKGDYGCEACGAVNPVYDAQCRKCGHKPPSPYAGRNKETIETYLKTLKR